MDRRELIKKSLAYSASSLIGTASWLHSALGPQERSAYAAAGPNEAPFRLSSPVRTQYDGQVIEHLAIEAEGQPGILISHRRVTVRQCKVRHRFGPGILARRAPGLILENCELDHTGAPESGPTEDT